MDFTFSEEQDALRATVRDALAAAGDAGTVRAAIDGDDDALAALWRPQVDGGWPALLVPTEHGGLGLGLVDAVVVLEETGRVTLPGPFLSSAVCATTAAGLLGLHRVLPDLASGATTGTIALEEQGHGDPVARVRTRAERHGGRWQLHGAKPLVLDLPGASWVLVAARTADGLGTFLIENPAGEPVATLDPTRRAGRLVLDGTEGEPVGPDGDHTAIWRAVADTLAVALAAELIGVGDAALALSIAYTGTRVQFDVPLSSHQVIQHKLVDMLHPLELARVGVHWAAWAADAGDPDRARAAAIAKATTGPAAVAITGDTIQVHGAVGFTWESDAHLLFKRAKQNDVLGGNAAWHRSRVADALLDTPA
jgi:alkylation response protein AidB-like acyl-CoA dehydrogenase